MAPCTTALPSSNPTKSRSPSTQSPNPEAQLICPTRPAFTNLQRQSSAKVSAESRLIYGSSSHGYQQRTKRKGLPRRRAKFAQKLDCRCLPLQIRRRYEKRTIDTLCRAGRLRGPSRDGQTTEAMSDQHDRLFNRINGSSKPANPVRPRRLAPVRLLNSNEVGILSRSANGHVPSRSTLERLRQCHRFQRRSQALPYHSSFRPNWICRDVVDVDVITPAVGDGVAEADPNTTAFGDPKLARLNTLKNSARN